MIISNGLSRVGVAGLLLGLSLAVSAREQVTQASVDIRRTSYGVPHIRAFDERGLGVGMGYAYAQDNLCLLANEVVTVNGERAKFFGPDQATLQERNNLASDVFFNWLNTPEAVAAFWKAQSRGLGSNGTKNQRKPYQRFSVSSSQAPISTKQLRMSASWLISVSRSCTLLSSSSSLRYGMVNS
ncbi:Acyl-homoserine lactone acylase PvdQ precursor [Pseudomonas fluorescens]|nr:Acyl-homoserine lactone acylase PvdQ precursor [Pseudomonas fluorescens]